MKPWCWHCCSVDLTLISKDREGGVSSSESSAGFWACAVDLGCLYKARRWQEHALTQEKPVSPSPLHVSADCYWLWTHPWVFTLTQVSLSSWWKGAEVGYPTKSLWKWFHTLKGQISHLRFEPLGCRRSEIQLPRVSGRWISTRSLSPNSRRTVAELSFIELLLYTYKEAQNTVSSLKEFNFGLFKGQLFEGKRVSFVFKFTKLHTLLTNQKVAKTLT